MAPEKIKSTNPNKRNLRTVKTLLAVLVFSLIAILLFKFYGDDLKQAATTVGKEEIQLQYVPADYESTINEQDAIAILENPQRYPPGIQ